MRRGEAHLVAVTLPAEFSHRGIDRSLVTGAEWRRVQRFRFDRHRDRWLFGRLTLKRLLARYLRYPAATVRLGFRAAGKPFLAAPLQGALRFNYTDSGGRYLYAFARDLELGVDLEALPRATDYRRLAPRKLSAPEREALSRLPEEARELAFLATWTRKEAYGKALGVGIRFPMRSVTTCEDYRDPSYRVASEDRETVELRQIAPPFDGIACLAVIGEGFRLRALRFEGE